MKVLHFYKTYLTDTIGGVEQVINQLCRGGIDLGVRAEVLSLSRLPVNQTVELDGHTVHHCYANFEFSSTPFSFSAIQKFKLLLNEADIVHYHFPYPFADFLHFLLNVNKPTLVTYHSDIIKQKKMFMFYQPFMYKFLSSVDRLVATSKNYSDSSLVLSEFHDKTSVIPIGIDKESYPKISNERMNVWNKRFNGRFFLFVGVLRYYKGLHVLIDAARNSNYPIVIAGAGAVESELKIQAEKYNVKNIFFIGFVSDEDKVALLKLCYALVFPSNLRAEAFGVSLLEGAMYGKALISCEISTGTSFINVDGLTGVVVPPNDPMALRGAMDYLWNNPTKAKLMGGCAEARYWELFTAKKMVYSYVELYKELIHDYGSRGTVFKRQ